MPGNFSTSPESIPAGAAVAIASTRSPTVPLAVGRIEILSTDTKGDENGKAVRVVHTWKDKLWQSGPIVEPPSKLRPLRDAREEDATAGTSSSKLGSDGKGASAVGGNTTKRPLINNGASKQRLSEADILTAEGSASSTVYSDI